jgi:small subunit ribosomal protein S6
MNIECGQDALDELEHSFRYNDAILRNLIIKTDKAITEPSVMMKSVERDDSRKSSDDNAPRQERDDDEVEIEEDEEEAAEE